MPRGPEQYETMHFPKAGLDVSQPFGKQPNRPIGPHEKYARTCAVGVNVRAFEPLTQRSRGGQRAGLEKYIPQAVVADWLIQELNTLTVKPSSVTQSGNNLIPISPTGGAVQASLSGRVVTLVAVSKGNIYVASPGDLTWTSPTNNTGQSPPLNFTGVMQSTAVNQLLFFSDGKNRVYYKPSNNTINTWGLTAGTFPQGTDADFPYPRLNCTWRGRLVQAGLMDDEQNWFMSRAFDPFDYEYGAAVEDDPTIAIAGNNSDAGLIGDVITALIPYSDDMLIFGGDHTIYIMRGDPLAGGEIDRVSDAIGMTFGKAWCKDPKGTVYFFSNLCGIFAFVPTSRQLVRISQAIDPLLRSVNTGTNGIRLLWDDRFEGFHVFITPYANVSTWTETTHYFFEARTGAWWQDKFASKRHNPLACCTIDGNEPNDRVPLIGSSDGYVRAVNPDAVDDDGTPIASRVVMGPYLTKDLDEIMLKSAQPVLGKTSAPITYKVLLGRTAEEALESTTGVNGVWDPSRNLTHQIQRRAHALYFDIRGTEPWALESVRLAFPAKVSKLRRRGY